MTISKNRYLTVEEMKINARYICDRFLELGWSKNAICGMLGNMQTESTINPGLWESMQEGNMTGGFGLVQWTPASKFTTWAESNGYSWGDIDGQIKRIHWEMENNYQWITTSTYPMSFKEFSTSNDTPYNLALIFIKNYERPLEPNQPIRGEQAEFWYKELEGGGGEIPPTPSDLYRCEPRYIYSSNDKLFGRKFTSTNKYFKLVARVGDMAIIDDKGRKICVYWKYLKKCKSI